MRSFTSGLQVWVHGCRNCPSCAPKESSASIRRAAQAGGASPEWLHHVAFLGVAGMSWVLNRFAPSVEACACLGLDLLLMSALVIAATPRPSLFTAGAVLVAIGVWLVTSLSIRHYTPPADRSSIDDTMLGAVLVPAVATVLL